MFLGEFPPLPPDVIQGLHRRTSELRAQMCDQFWDTLASQAVNVFEGWRRPR